MPQKCFLICGNAPACIWVEKGHSGSATTKAELNKAAAEAIDQKFGANGSKAYVGSDGPNVLELFKIDD